MLRQDYPLPVVDTDTPPIRGVYGTAAANLCVGRTHFRRLIGCHCQKPLTPVYPHLARQKTKMAYRVSKKRREQLAQMRAARAAKRLSSDAPIYPRELPILRRRLVITNYDFGEVVHTLDLYQSDRIDCYNVHVDGKPWKSRIGWSRILSGLRKSLPRVLSESNICS